MYIIFPKYTKRTYPGLVRTTGRGPHVLLKFEFWGDLAVAWGDLVVAWGDLAVVWRWWLCGVVLCGVVVTCVLKGRIKLSTKCGVGGSTEHLGEDDVGRGVYVFSLWLWFWTLRLRSNAVGWGRILPCVWRVRFFLVFFKPAIKAGGGGIFLVKGFMKGVASLDIR